MLGEGGLRIKTQRIINIYEPGVCSKDVSEVNFFFLQEEARSYKMQRPSHNKPHCIYRINSSKYTWKKG